MSEKKTVLTSEGLKRLEEELEELKSVRRKDVAEKIKEARAQGDLSENAEFDAAKEEQAEIEARVAELEKLLRNADIIDEDDLIAGIINVGSKVKLLDMEYDEELEYIIVGSMETDPLGGRISNESPLGMALLGKTIGEVADVSAPDGVNHYKVLDILKGAFSNEQQPAAH